MIYDAIEQAYAVTSANFATDLAALITAKGLSGLTSTATIIKRQRAETAVTLGATLPVLGIVAVGARTQAKDQGKRDTQVAVEWDYYAEGTDVVKLAKQGELAAEAVMLTVDRLAASGMGVFGAGEQPLDVLVEMSEGVEEAEHPLYWRRATVRAGVWDRDVV